jgi:hypothetical protein
VLLHITSIPFNAEVIPPIVLTQPYEGGYEGDIDNAGITKMISTLLKKKMKHPLQMIHQQNKMSYLHQEKENM